MLLRNVSQTLAAPQIYITQSLFSPAPMFLKIPSPYIPHSLCFPCSQSRCSPEMFPSPVVSQTYIIQSLCSPVPKFPTPYISPKCLRNKGTGIKGLGNVCTVKHFMWITWLWILWFGKHISGTCGLLTHWGPVTQFGDTDLGQHWLR